MLDKSEIMVELAGYSKTKRDILVALDGAGRRGMTRHDIRVGIDRKNFPGLAIQTLMEEGLVELNTPIAILSMERHRITAKGNEYAAVIIRESKVGR